MSKDMKTPQNQRGPGGAPENQIKIFNLFVKPHAILTGILALVFVLFFIREADFLLVSLRWPLAISLDASIVRFESWSLLRGEWPWRDIVSINLPVTHLIHIFGLKLFGGDDLGFRLYDLFWVAGLASLTFLYLRRHSRMAAWIGAVLVLWLPVEATPFGAFQRETLMLPFWLATVLVIERFWMESNLSVSRSRFLFAAAGAATAFATLIKPTSVFLAILLLLYLFHFYFHDRKGEHAVPAHRGKGSRIRDMLLITALFGVGGILAVTLIAIYLSANGMLGTFLSSWYKQTSAYMELYETVSPFTILRELFIWNPRYWSLSLNQALPGPVSPTGHFTLFHLLLLGLWSYFTVTRRRFPGALLIVAAGVAGYLFQRRGFQYHLYPVWYGFLLMAATLLSDLTEQVRNYRANLFSSPDPESKEADSSAAKSGELLDREGAPDYLPSLKRRLREMRLALPSLEQNRWFSLASFFLALLLAFSLYSIQGSSLDAYGGTGLYSKKRLESMPDLKVVRAIGEIVETLREVPGIRIREDEYHKPLSLETLESSAFALGAVMRYNLAFVSRYPVDYILWKNSRFRKEARADLMESLRRTPPDMIAYAYDESEEFREGRLSEFAELARWIEEGYRPVREVREVTGRNYRIFLRKDYVKYLKNGQETPEGENSHSSHPAGGAP